MAVRDEKPGRILATVASAAFLAFTSGAGAQTIQPKPVQPAPAPAPQAQQAPSPQAPPVPQWMMACTNIQAGLDCSVGQSLVFQGGGRNVQVAVALRIPADTKKPNLLLQVPLGVSLSKGLTIQFGSGGAKGLAFQSCNQNGCLAEYSITEAEISTLLKGADLTLSVETTNKTPLTFRVPAAGFADAYAKMTSR